MPSLAEIVMEGGRQRADSLRRIADIEANRRAQRSALWVNAGANLAGLATNAIMDYRGQKLATEQKRAEMAAAEPLRQAQLTQTGLQNQKLQLDLNAATRTQQATATQEAATQKFVALLPDGKMQVDMAQLVPYLKSQNQMGTLQTILDTVNKHNSIQNTQAQQHLVEGLDGAFEVAQDDWSVNGYYALIDRIRQKGALSAEELAPFEQKQPKTPEEVEKILRPWLELSTKYGDQFKLEKTDKGLYDHFNRRYIEPPAEVGTLRGYLQRTYGAGMTREQELTGTAEYERSLHPAAPPAPRQRRTSWQDISVDGKPMRVLKDDDTGQTIKVEEPGARLARPPTGADRQTLGFYHRMEKALDDMTTVEDQVTVADLAILNGNLPMPDIVGNKLLTSAGQQYAQALRTYTEARLRKESGAAIAKHEFVSDRLAIAKQVGDTPATLAQKRATRSLTAESFAEQSGPAYEEHYGYKYKDRPKTDETKKVNAPATAGTIRNFDGVPHYWDDKQKRWIRVGTPAGGGGLNMPLPKIERSGR